MPPTPGASVPYDPARAFHVWKHFNPHGAQDPGAAWAAAISYEQRHAVTSMAEFSGLHALLERLLTVLETMRVEDEAVRFAADHAELLDDTTPVGRSQP